MDAVIQDLVNQIADLRARVALLEQDTGIADAVVGSDDKLDDHPVPLIEPPTFPDEASCEFAPASAGSSKEGLMQIKGWHNGTPKEASTLSELLAGDTPSSLLLVARDSDGDIKYLRLGSMTGSVTTEEVTVVVDSEYVTSGDSPRLVQKKRKIWAVAGGPAETTESTVFTAVPHQPHD